MNRVNSDRVNREREHVNTCGAHVSTGSQLRESYTSEWSGGDACVTWCGRACSSGSARGWRPRSPRAKCTAAGDSARLRARTATHQLMNMLCTRTYCIVLVLDMGHLLRVRLLRYTSLIIRELYGYPVPVRECRVMLYFKRKLVIESSAYRLLTRNR